MSAKIWIRRSTAVFVTAAAAFVFVAPRAEAGHAAFNNPLTVSTTVQASAQLTTNNLTFASYDGTQNLFASTNFQFVIPGASAANPATVEVGFIGTGTGNGVFQMSNGTHTLNYDLCQNSTCTTLFASNYWGTAFNVTTPSYTYTLYGEIPKGQALPPAGTVMSQTIGAYMTY
jgi:L-aminopeptidase/D-esterase-like protein